MAEKYIIGSEALKIHEIIRVLLFDHNNRLEERKLYSVVRREFFFEIPNKHSPANTEGT